MCIWCSAFGVSEVYTWISVLLRFVVVGFDWRATAVWGEARAELKAWIPESARCCRGGCHLL